MWKGDPPPGRCSPPFRLVSLRVFTHIISFDPPWQPLRRVKRHQAGYVSAEAQISSTDGMYLLPFLFAVNSKDGNQA